MKRPRLILAALLAAAPAFGEVPAVTADIPPVHSLVALVMGDLGAPELLVDPGMDAHAFQLRPSQAAALSDSALLFWVGHAMTPWLERAIEADFGGKAVELLEASGLRTRSFAEPHADADEADQDAEHGHEGVDPHAWLDPGNAIVWLDLIAAELSAADPDNAAAYAANRDAAKAEIAALDADLVNLLRAAGQRPIVVGHDAYGYFAEHYGLRIAAALAEGDAADPGAQHLSEIAALLARETVQCLFPEAGHDSRRAALIADGTGVRIGAPLDPEGQMLAPGPQLYGALMRGLATAVADCQSAD